jgi:peptidylprolyl isomerase
MPRTALALALLLGAGLTACSSSKTTLTQTGSGATTTTVSSSVSCGNATALAPAEPTAVDLTKKPVVTVPATPPPSALVVQDIVVGTGPLAACGTAVTVQYVGVAYSTKKQFDASWDRGQPFPFTLGAGQVIPGWDQGVVGMKVGGRRVLTIPAALGYGTAGTSDGTIGPNETLVFVVDLIKVG